MKRTQLVLVLAGIAALALGGSAIAAKSHSHATRAAVGAAPGWRHGHGHGDDLDAAASYLGKSTSDLLAALQSGKTLASIADATAGKSAAGLVAALVAHEKQELVDAVTAGRLTQAQSDTIAATLQQRFQDVVNGTLPRDLPRHERDRGGLDAAASYLGITADALATQLRSGKTLAQIANATSGKSAAGLIDAIVAGATKRFGTNLPPDLRQHITDLVNGVMPRLHPRGPGMGDGDHHGWGAPPPGGRSS
jgi:hypothetical protein